MTTLATRDLAVGYRSRRQRRAVLENLSLEVSPGDLVCLLGPNGIGKSTLLRTLARMQPALWGHVELGGADLRSISQIELARRLGVVLTDRVAVEALTARRIVELGRYPHSGWLGTLDDAGRRVVDWAMDAVGIAYAADRDFSRLSDGERQRVMIARALAQEPVLLILDEPTAFLDVPSRVELMALLRQLTRGGPPSPLRGFGAASSLAVIIATHDLELALRTADVVWLMMPGGEVVTGAPEDIVLSGGIARAFEGRQIRFHAEDRSFRLLTGNRGVAAVSGSGIRAAMAAAVLEREGYAVERGGVDPDMLVEIEEHGWRAGTATGSDFASLAAHLRGRSTDV